MSGDYVVRFASHQPLPPGYVVEWLESVEHYIWRCGERESCITWDRWAAWRGAWADYRAAARHFMGAK